MTVKFSKDIIVPGNYSSFGPKQMLIWVESDDPLKLAGTNLIWSTESVT